MKKKVQKKLTLSRETLHRLAAEQVQGAAARDSILICDPPPPTSDSMKVCCA